MTKLLLALMLSLSASYASAQLTIAAGTELHYDKGQPHLELRYFGQQWKHWTAYVATNNTIGADLYYNYHNIDFALGIEYSNPDINVVSTYFAYQARIEYKLSDKWSIALKHRSNCKTVCDNKLLSHLPHGNSDSINHGYNYILLRYTL